MQLVIKWVIYDAVIATLGYPGNPGPFGQWPGQNFALKFFSYIGILSLALLINAYWDNKTREDILSMVSPSPPKIDLIRVAVLSVLALLSLVTILRVITVWEQPGLVPRAPSSSSDGYSSNQSREQACLDRWIAKWDYTAPQTWQNTIMRLEGRTACSYGDSYADDIDASALWRN